MVKKKKKSIQQLKLYVSTLIPSPLVARLTSSERLGTSFPRSPCSPHLDESFIKACQVARGHLNISAVYFSSERVALQVDGGPRSVKINQLHCRSDWEVVVKATASLQKLPSWTVLLLCRLQSERPNATVQFCIFHFLQCLQRKPQLFSVRKRIYLKPKIGG